MFVTNISLITALEKEFTFHKMHLFQAYSPVGLASSKSYVVIPTPQFKNISLTPKINPVLISSHSLFPPIIDICDRSIYIPPNRVDNHSYSHLRVKPQRVDRGPLEAWV